MKKPFTVEAEYNEHNLDGGAHRTRSFAALNAALEYAHWARYRAIFVWSLVRYKGRPVVVWDGGGYEQYYNFDFIPKE